MASMRPPRWTSSTAPAPPMPASRAKSGKSVSRMRSRKDNLMTALRSLRKPRANNRSQLVALPLPPERGRVDAEDGSRLLDGRRRGQHAADVLQLKLLQRHPAADLDARPRRSDLRRQVCQAHLRTGRKDDAAFDSVAQLADVARPGVPLQRRPRLLAKAGDRLARLPGE